MLDEPTNDLDLETLDLLQELLADYQGTVLLVSHDRDFIDRVVSATLISDGDGVWTEFAGGYTDMLAQRGRGVGAQAAGAGRQAHGCRQAGGELRRRPAAKRKLSFNEKHALETLPKRDRGAAGRSGEAQRRDGRRSLHARSKAVRQGDGAAGRGRPARSRTPKSRWLELEMLREEIEA